MADFDHHAETYQATVRKAAGVSVDGLAREKARLIRDVLAAALGDPRRLSVLDIGCGIGLIEAELEKEVGQLSAVDVSPRSVEFARSRVTSTRFQHYDGTSLPFADATFDAAFASCVLHHVKPVGRDAFMAEMLRVLRPSGLAILIEHNPLNPVTQLIVSRCPFDADASLLTCRRATRLLTGGGAKVVGRRFVGFSPIRNGFVERMERLVGWLPVGAQYCVWGVKA